MLGQTPRSSIAAPRFGGTDLRPSVRTYVRGEGHQRTNLGEGHGRTAVLETSNGGAQDEYLDKPRFSYRGLGVHDLRTYIRKYPCLRVCTGCPSAPGKPRGGPRTTPASSVGRQRPRQCQSQWTGQRHAQREGLGPGIGLGPRGEQGGIGLRSPRSIRCWLRPRNRLRPWRMRLRPRRRWLRTRSRTRKGKHMYATLRTYVRICFTYVLSFPM